MITIRPCTTADCDSIAGLWNAMTAVADSCWFQAPTVDGQAVSNLLEGGYAMAVAESAGQITGFGIWCGPVENPRLVALAAEADEAYYRLMAEYCGWGIAGGASFGFAEIGTRATIEKGRMDALEVISYVAIGFEPILPGDPPAQRVPKLLRAECALELLNQKLAEVLGGSP